MIHPLLRILLDLLTSIRCSPSFDDSRVPFMTGGVGRSGGIDVRHSYKGYVTAMLEPRAAIFRFLVDSAVG